LGKFHPREDHHIRTLQRPQRLPQNAARQQRALPEWVRGINEHDVQVTRQTIVLKPIIQNNHLRAKMLTGMLAACEAIPAYQNRDSR
jgi:hypothetical protein